MMEGLEPGTSRLSMISECAYHLRFIPTDPSAHTHFKTGIGPSEDKATPFLQKFLIYEVNFWQGKN